MLKNVHCFGGSHRWPVAHRLGGCAAGGGGPAGGRAARPLLVDGPAPAGAPGQAGVPRL